MSEFTDLVCSCSEGLVRLTASQLAQLEEHYHLLERWNRKLNLTSIRTLEPAVRRHYVESLALGALLSQWVEWPAVQSVVDVGSGAGFPGIPLAILFPDRRFDLVESHRRKAVFLSEASQSLKNVRVVASRFEAVSGSYDLAISRAVAWSDIAGNVPEVSKRVALLVGPTDVDSVRGDPRFNWCKPARVPAGQGFVLVGISGGT